MGRCSYITINRDVDWNKGLLVGLRLKEDGLRLESPGRIARGVYYSAALDSREREFEWSRVILDGDFPSGVITSISAYASDLPPTEPDEHARLRSIHQETAADHLSLDTYYTERYDGARDVLLHAKGRYLWLRVELFVSEGGHPCLTGIRAQYTGDHMEDYLPAIYRDQGKTGFTHRFLSAFNSMALDLEEEIYRQPGCFDYRRAKGKMLHFLASWVGLDSQGISDEKLREQVVGMVHGGRLRQTPKGIRELVKLWTGSDPILLEHFQVRELIQQGRDRALYEQLYGAEPGVFFLLMEEDVFPTAEDRERFITRLERMVPANVKPRLVLLKRDAYLDWHTYLGVNSVIGGFSPAITDSGVSIHYDTMIGGPEIEKP